MTVQELIDKLNKVEDKTKPVVIEVKNYNYSEHEYEYVCNGDPLCVYETTGFEIGQGIIFISDDSKNEQEEERIEY